jgi:hypothetical protein
MNKTQLKTLLKTPYKELKHRGSLRALYKLSFNAVAAIQYRELNRLRATLPPPDPRQRVDRAVGFKVVPPEAGFAAIPPVLDRCRRWLADGKTAEQRPDKPQLEELITDDDLPDLPEFVDFALDPQLLGVAADYLGGFPLLTKIAFWHSHATDAPLGNSQLYHCDYEDERQLKAFLHVSDVEAESGPLTALPADLSRSLRRQLRDTRYRKIRDEEICPLIPEGAEKVLTGPAGSTALIDTSQALHYGSRVASKDRYVVVVQYLSLTNYVMSPLPRFRQHPLAGLARAEQTPAQRAALTGAP